MTGRPFITKNEEHEELGRRRTALPRNCSLSVLVGLILVAAGSLLAAQRQPTFRTETNAVALDLRVVDSTGRFVRDLTQEEFKVFEDGHEQPISTFELVDLPLATPPSSQSRAFVGIASDVTSNVDIDGRLYVIVLDDYNPTTPESGLSPSQELARELIFHMAPSDRAAIVTTAGRRDMAQEFTNDRGRLLATVDPFAGNRGQSDVPVSMTGAPIPNPFDTVHDVMLSLKDVANWLSGVPGRRKAIVLISARMSSVATSLSLTNFSKAAGLQNVSLAADMRDLVAATSRANTSIYTLNPVTVQTFGFLPGEYALARGDDDLDGRVTIARATGGFSSAGNFAGVFERIAAESGSYYLLGYTPSRPKDDGEFHRIEVRTTRANLRVLTRTGYYDRAVPSLKRSMIPSGMPRPLTEAMQSPAAVAGIPMSMTVVPYRGKGSTAVVSIAIDMHAEDGFDSQVRPPGKPIEVAIAAAKVNAKVRDLRRIAVGGGTIVTRMELKPGRYHMRVGALDTADNRRGSLLYDVDVPDFSKRGLIMSGISLTSSLTTRRAVTGSDERWMHTMGAPPTTQRMFSAADDLIDYVEVYDNRKPAGQLYVTTTVRTEEGRVLFTEHRTSSVKSVKGTPPLHEIKTTIPLSTIASGSYVLRVEARGSGDAAGPVSRAIPFGVR